MQTSPCLLKKCYKSYCSQISMLWCSLMIIGEVWNCHQVIVGDNSKPPIIINEQYNLQMFSNK